ncbi:MAG: class I SAM-dependent methyltransferase [Saprospirales bacterium]|nr:class I SAM-dependent methyltransferase [Saprospirales bacterium]MBK8492525.1 class I SAM-dependent methyltransferase [Saprospirales bacterium]
MKGFFQNISAGKWLLLGGLLLLIAQVVVLVDWLVLDSYLPWLSAWFFGSAILVLLVLVYRKLIINYNEYKSMTNNGFAQVEALFYLHSRLQLRRALPRMRSFGISPDFANVLVDYVLKVKPGVIVECGGGISTLVNGYLLEQQGGGHVYALEHDASFARQTQEELQRHSLVNWATVIHAPLEAFHLDGKEWKWYAAAGWKDLPGIDFLIIDGPPAYIQEMARYPGFPLLLEKLNPDATILVDDCIRPEDRQTVEKWIHDFPDWEVEWVRTEKLAAVIRRKSF